MILQGDFLLAYIDPLTGAIILQVIVAGALSVSATFRRLVVTPVMSLFRKVRGQTVRPDAAENQEDRTD